MRTTTLILLGLAVVAAGCSATTEGVVRARSGFTAGWAAPDIPFVSADGRQTSLHRERLPIAIVAFVVPTGPDCSQLQPELAAITAQFAHLPISVVQVSEPSPACNYGPGCIQVSGAGKRDILAICDQARIAWTSYSQPKPGTVFLINKSGVVKMTGALDNMQPLVDRAVEMGQSIADMHHGGWSGQY